MPPCTVHRFWNDGNEELRLVVDFRPALRPERFFEQLWTPGLTRWGFPGLRLATELAREGYLREVSLPWVPVVFQRGAQAALAGLGRLLANLPEDWNVGNGESGDWSQDARNVSGTPAREDPAMERSSVTAMMRRRTSLLALGLWFVSAALVAASFVLLTLDAGVEVPGTGLFGSRFAEAVIVLPILSFATVGAFIASRQPWNRVGWVLCAGGASLAVATVASEYAIRALFAEPGSLPGGDWAAWASSWLFIPALFVSGALLLLLFPHGRLLSARWRIAVWLAILGIASLCLGSAFTPGTFQEDPFTEITNPAGVEGAGMVFETLYGFGWAPFMVAFVAAGISVALRFRRSGPEIRQQIKWVSAAAVLFATAFLALGIASDSTQAAQDVTATLSWIALTSIPLATGVAILRYRLYDIDVIVRKTLVYGAASALLAGLYFAIVIGLQAAFSGFTRGNDLAIAGSTLAVAALFRPARARIQSFIDRRFYRRRYDTEQTLGAFSARLRDELDLDTLARELDRVVRETMRPAHLSLWLRSREGRP